MGSHYSIQREKLTEPAKDELAFELSNKGPADDGSGHSDGHRADLRNAEVGG
jgi:hypothetical protein